MLRLIYFALVVVALVGVSGGLAGGISNAPVLTVPQVADDTGPTAPPFPLGPQLADDTGPTAPPFPLGPQLADDTGPTAPPFPLAA
jgi:hypothetical protein